MITDWIYNSPTWIWGSLLVLLTIGLSCAGLVAFHRLVDLRLRRAHNELAGYVVNLIGVVYAVLLAFIAVVTWETFSEATNAVEKEAASIDNSYRDTRGLPADAQHAMEQTLLKYTETVIHVEWPQQMRGEAPVEGWRTLHKLHKEVVAFQPTTRGEAVLLAELLTDLNDLYAARQERLSATTSHIPAVIWVIIAIGGVVTTGFTYLFGFESLRMHLAMTGALAGSLALVIVLIIALDWPYRGEVSVSPEPYITIEQSWGLTESDAAPMPGPLTHLARQAP